ncbi:hypothetical protein [Streptomyces sp. UH6]|uniref:hypothetical protein n=1 Tax=Streptomyces sp. UH6 TaxID=2748379 RepID=UPI0015D5037A|nr:hypothetical protein [Streptomyces sp. UH6]NYV73105.1 hypothetical protein [Streptomyces sp. UH6]
MSTDNKNSGRVEQLLRAAATAVNNAVNDDPAHMQERLAKLHAAAQAAPPAPDLAAITARANAATPGPWTVERDESSLHRFVVSEDHMLTADLGYLGNSSQDDAAFIAAARTDVPALLARVAELEIASRQWGERWQARCDHLAKQGLRWKAEADGRKKYGEKLRARVAELEAQAATAPGEALRKAAKTLRDGNTDWTDDTAAQTVDEVAEWLDQQAAKVTEAAAAVPLPGSPAHTAGAEQLLTLAASADDETDATAYLAALRQIREGMERDRAAGDEWAMEWMGEVWGELPLAVRAAAGDQDAADELADAEAGEGQ